MKLKLIIQTSNQSVDIKSNQSKLIETLEQMDVHSTTHVDNKIKIDSITVIVPKP